ncbi:isochorismatase family protein [Streptacidiphilus sp. PAMC 29251]
MATALLLIDVQRNMLEPPTPVPDAPAVAAALTELLERARQAGATVVHIRNNGGAQDPDAPGSPGWELVHQPFPEEFVADKFSSDGFLGTGIAERLPQDDVLVLAGFQSEYCIRATAVSGLAQGYRVVVAGGAHGTFPDGEPAAEISARIERELAAAGVDVLPYQEIRF